MVLGKRIVYDLYPDGGCVLPQTDKVQILVVDACRQTGELQDALQHVMTMIAALLGIYIQYLALSLWQTGSIVKNLTVGE